MFQAQENVALNKTHTASHPPEVCSLVGQAEVNDCTGH